MPWFLRVFVEIRTLNASGKKIYPRVSHNLIATPKKNQLMMDFVWKFRTFLKYQKRNNVPVNPNNFFRNLKKQLLHDTKKPKYFQKVKSPRLLYSKKTKQKIVVELMFLFYHALLRKINRRFRRCANWIENAIENLNCRFFCPEPDFRCYCCWRTGNKTHTGRNIVVKPIHLLATLRIQKPPQSEVDNCNVTCVMV